ncbi:hypothetical protein H4CHR_03040 [Variovorax sp. PBS-H4]|uniref:hypothetical protein n=1 Tax=Variovorax sp. PBS-H4 TaxID=434008 RepID=UPI00131699B2|nr:hypothetical protein [Variovorax sp. PBS-H4]VTU32579.1 hypothetical protein H4CHR_03040 [Variovorax sp. PBS-H4]
MNIVMGIRTSIFMCAALTISACYDSGVKSKDNGATPVALKAQATEQGGIEGRLDAYFGERFSEAQKALSTRAPDPDAPSF